jgi:hypothetical protein
MDASQLRVHHEDVKRGPRILHWTCEYGGVVFPYAEMPSGVLAHVRSVPRSPCPFPLERCRFDAASLLTPPRPLISFRSA